MSKYSDEFKIQVAEHYLQSTDSFISTSNKFQIDHGAVRRWVSLYQRHGANSLKKKPNVNYSSAFKRSVIEHMHLQGWSIRQTAAHFNIPAFTTVSVWEKRYDDGKIEASYVRRGRPKTMAKSPPPSLEKPLEEMTHQELLAEARYLRTEHAYLKKLDALIQRKQLEEKNKQK